MSIQHALHPAHPRAPRRKVIGASSGAAFGAAFTAVACWAANHAGLFSEPIPNELQASITIVVTAGLSFLSGYLTPERN